MGSGFSAGAASVPDDIWWTNGDNRPTEIVATSEETPQRPLSAEGQQKLNEFKLEFARKHEKRRQILDQKKQEMMDLREEVDRLKKENEVLKKSSGVPLGENSTQIDRLLKINQELRGEIEQKDKLLEKSEALTDKNKELRISIAEMQKELQDLNTEVLNFEKERHDYQTHVVALKDVIKVSKHMLTIRENQLKELKEKVNSIEASLEGREMNILSQDLRSEYEKQLQNIRNLRTLYEERQQADRRQKEELQSTLTETRKELEREQKKSSDLEERVTQLEEENSKKYDEIKSLESNLGLNKAECRQYQAELTVINQLFSEILLGFQNSQDIDLDQLTKHLEDHHELLQNIVVNEISSEISSALPKVLLDLVNQVNDKKKGEEEPKTPEGCSSRKLETIIEESESQTSTVQQMNSAEEIAELLPKVWKVLIELLSHQKAPTNEIPGEDDDDPCYKTVQTSKGPSLVLSVSQTFIRLKDLILEKKSLEKEMSHLKHLNGHLENRLQDQEKRLEMVSSELSKTWHVVGKLQKQHHLLHTQEKILRYELAQKRKLLTTLKEELEYSREKWQQAREKNSNTEEQWRQLRTEFASRRVITSTDDYNNSVESGYSDDRSSDDEPGYETDISESKPEQSSTEEVDESKLDLEEGAGVDEINLVLKEEGKTEDEVLEESKLLEIDDQTPLEEDLESGAKVDDLVDEGKTEEEEKTGEEAEKPKKTLEEVLAARDERFKRLEGQAERLVRQVTDTNHRGVAMASKLDDLHEAYGEGASTSRGGGAGDSGEGEGQE